MLLEAMPPACRSSPRHPRLQERRAAGGAGLLVEPRNDRALAAALYRLANDEELRHKMGEAGARKATESTGTRSPSGSWTFTARSRRRRSTRGRSRARAACGRRARSAPPRTRPTRRRRSAPERLRVDTQAGLVRPASRRTRRLFATRERAIPRRRHGARTPTESTQPRFRPSSGFASRSIRLSTWPTIVVALRGNHREADVTARVGAHLLEGCRRCRSSLPSGRGDLDLGPKKRRRSSSRAGRS